MNHSQWFRSIEAIVKHNTGDISQFLTTVSKCPDCKNFELAEEIIQKAAEYGRTNILIQAFERFPYLHNSIHVSFSLSEAAKNGHLEAIKFLLTHNNNQNKCSTSLEQAAFHGHPDCVSLLIPLSDCRDMSSQALRYAARRNNLECVKLLLPHSNPQARTCEALQWACVWKNKEMFELLYPLSLAQETLEYMKDLINHEFGQADIDFFEAHHTAFVLQHSLENSESFTVRTKKI